MIRDQIADQLVYSTVRIWCEKSTMHSSGTGFFLIKNYSDGSNINAIVTNKHVVEGFEKAEISFAGVSDDGSPDDHNQVIITINDLQRKIFPHPSPEIDICLLFINDEIEKSRQAGKQVYYLSIGAEMIISPADADLLTPIEDVIMIGYPQGIIDTYNNKPVVRKGITATSLKLDYNGTSDFLIDIACFPGSSGSPIFLRKEGLEKEEKDTGIQIGISPRYSLLGVVHSMLTAKTNGDIVVNDILYDKPK